MNRVSHPSICICYWLRFYTRYCDCQLHVRLKYSVNIHFPYSVVTKLLLKTNVALMRADHNQNNFCKDKYFNYDTIHTESYEGSIVLKMVSFRPPPQKAFKAQYARYISNTQIRPPNSAVVEDFIQCAMFENIKDHKINTSTILRRCTIMSLNANEEKGFPPLYRT